jgi:hypothetical protein
MKGKTQILRGYLLGPVAIYRAKERQKADEFCHDWLERANLDRDHPVLALARYFDSPTSKFGGSDGARARYQHVALALSHYDSGTKVNTIRNSDLGCEWLRSLSPANTRKVRDILGADDVPLTVEKLREK